MEVEAEIGLCIVHLVCQAVKQVRPAARSDQRQLGTRNACEMEDTNVFEGEAMLFRGVGMQNRHTLLFSNRPLLC